MRRGPQGEENTERISDSTVSKRGDRRCDYYQKLLPIVPSQLSSLSRFNPESRVDS